MKKLYILIAVIMGFVFAANSHIFAATSSVDIEALKEEVKKELRAEKPWKKDFNKWGVDIHGFVSQGYMHSEDNNFLANDSASGTFQYNEIGINFSKQITNKLRIGLQLFSHDLGDISNNEILLDWAFADYRWKDWLGLRVGRIKAPHGLYNEGRDIDMLRTSIFLPQSVYAELNRDTMVAVNGFGFYGDIPLDTLGTLSYNVLAGTSDVDADSGAAKQFNSARVMGMELWEADDFDMGETYVGSLQWQTPLDGLRLKGTIRRSDLGIPAETGAFFFGVAGIPVGTEFTYEMERTRTIVGSIEYTWNDLIVAAEYQDTKADIYIEVPGWFANPYADTTTNNDGYYVSATYRVNNWLEVGSYYSKYYADSDDRDGKDSVGTSLTYDYQNWLEDIALSCRFDINQYWLFKLEGHIMDGAAYCLTEDNDDFEEDWWMVTAKMTFSF